MKDRRDRLPLVLFELSLMRETVHRFAPAARDDARQLLARLAALESKAWRLMRTRSGNNHPPRNH
ncbi:MAG: hypothetical protein WB973_23015 [Thermoanaerobaculia bacterium]